MKVPLSSAAAGPDVTRPQPMIALSPLPSKRVMVSTASADHGNFAPTNAQPMPSSSRYLARVRTASGTSSSDSFVSQLESAPVTPAGSVGARSMFTITLQLSSFPLTSDAVRYPSIPMHPPPRVHSELSPLSLSSPSTPNI